MSEGGLSYFGLKLSGEMSMVMMKKEEHDGRNSTSHNKSGIINVIID